MPTHTYSIGLDFGSDSVRALLVRNADGTELASAVAHYPRWATGAYCNPVASQYRQHPLDYVEALETCVRAVLDAVTLEVRAAVVAIGVDTTGSTPVAVDAQGTPLAMLPGFADNPNAMFFLWKDHTGVAEAEEINAFCAQHEPNYLKYSGGIYSAEWFWAKVLHLAREDAEVWAATYSWVEHCDWVPYLLTGGTDVRTMRRSRCAAGHKALWHPSWSGLPPDDFLAALDPRLVGLRDRLYTETYTTDEAAGTLSADWATRLGLHERVTVAVGAFDAHIGAVGAGAQPRQLAKIMGTSTCDILVADAGIEEQLVPGICGQVDGSVLPGLLGLEAGQSAFGDLYAWFERLVNWPLENVLREATWMSATDRDRLRQQMMDATLPALSAAAERLPIGGGGEVAVDWINGRRTPDANQRLQGAIAGLNLGSDAPRVFRALVEASCYGARAIVERLRSGGYPVEGVVALGGVAQKSPFVMQVMADVLDLPIRVTAAEQACALGAAMFGATAAGVYPSVAEAAAVMEAGYSATYTPDVDRVAAYSKGYRKYLSLARAVEGYTERGLTQHDGNTQVDTFVPTPAQSK